MGVLYVVATPIGNLEDITLRALGVLSEAGLIAAEDTRTTRKLLNHYHIATPLTSYHEHNKRAKIPLLMEALKEKDVALVCDAGTPVISDPGQELVQEAIRAGVQVVPVPGPSALTAALAVAGLEAETVLFLGFLPRHKGKRRQLLESMRNSPFTAVAYEAPHRLVDSLGDMLAALGDREIAVCRELTKVHEEIFRGTVSQAVSHFSVPRGEFTLVIGAASPAKEGGDQQRAVEELRHLKDRGLKAREAVAMVSGATGIPKREVYRLWLELGRVIPPVSGP